MGVPEGSKGREQCWWLGEARPRDEQPVYRCVYASDREQAEAQEVGCSLRRFMTALQERRQVSLT